MPRPKKDPAELKAAASLRSRRYHYKKKDINIDDPEETRGGAQGPGRRGRPPKKKPAPSESNVEDLEETREGTQGSGRRGRPPKKKPSPPEPDVEGTDAVTDGMQRLAMHQSSNRECEFDHLKSTFNSIRSMFAAAHPR